MIAMQESLEKVYNAKLVDLNGCIYVSENKTPSHSFMSAYIILNSEIIVNISVRDFARKDIFIAFCKQMSELKINSIYQITKIINLDFVNLDFDALLLLPPEYHIMGYEDADEMEILRKTIVAIPIYHCEFSGNESAKEIKSLRRDFICTVDWNRDVSPQFKFRYKNYKTQGGTTGKKFYFAHSRNLMNEIDDLNDEDSYIEFENYKHELFELKWCNNKINIIQNNAVLVSDSVDNIKNIVWKYIKI